jgi:hypothetical protein
MPNKWEWVEKPPLGGMDASAMSKLFRNQETSGVDSLSRETLQNSWDAAESKEGFRMVFRFEEFSGPDKKLVVDALNLRALDEYERNVRPMDFVKKNALKELEDLNKPLRILYVEDYGAHGLRGPIAWKSKSELFKAIYDIGSSDKNASAGGSYGFGKSAMFINSRIYCVVAYSAFESGYSRPDSPAEVDAASRRLIGFAWWKGHSQGTREYDGRGMLANGNVPFEDADADALAVLMKIPVRNPKDRAERGTTFAIIDHSVEPDELMDSLESNWWPAIERHGLKIEVYVNGKARTPNPNRLAELQPYRRAYRVAMGEEVGAGEWKWSAETTPPLEAFGEIQPGRLAIVRLNPNNIQEGVDGAQGAKIALIRKPHMVVSYQAFQSSHVLRGAYIASEAVSDQGTEENELLRLAENAAHDRWSKKVETDAQDRRPWQLAGIVSERISRAVTQIRNALAEEKTDDRVRSGLLAEYLEVSGDGLGRGRDIVDPPPRTFKIERGEADLYSDPADPTKIRVHQPVTITLVNKRRKSTRVAITASCVLVEDGGSGGTKTPMELTDGVSAPTFEYRTTMTHATKIELTASSESFDCRWSSRVVFEPVILNGAGKSDE